LKSAAQSLIIGKIANIGNSRCGLAAAHVAS
jgi:hypothetical protein